MGVGVMRALEWNLDAVHARVTDLSHGVTEIDDLARAIRSDSERTLDGMSGYTIHAAHEATDQAVQRTFRLSDHLTTAAVVLSNFATNVTVQQTRLRTEVDQVVQAGAHVAEDGTVTPPPGADSSEAVAFGESELAIKSTLRSLGELDVEASSALTELHGSIADYGDNTDPRTTIAAMTISSQTDTLAALLKDHDDRTPSAKWGSRLLGPFGSALGFASGVAGAPDDEEMSETLIAEGGGLAAGVAGAAIGSVIPGVGTVAGALIGVGIAGAASYATTKGIRDHFDAQRETGG